MILHMAIPDAMWAGLRVRRVSLLFVGLVALGLIRPVAAQTPAEPQAVRLPELDVVERPVPGENKIIGTYGQPEWSARRPFPGVSVYVVPDGEYEFEVGFDRQTLPTGAARREWTQELEIGLGHRWQLALQNSARDFREDGAGPLGWHEDSLTASLRHALGDWGKVPLNPALSFGWRAISGAPGAAQAGVVVGGELTPRWHWAANVGAERQLRRSGSREVAGDAALTYSIANETLNLGVQAGWKSRHGEDTLAATYAHAGPCLQFRPWDEVHLNAVYLRSDGSRGAPRNELQISIGFEFGDGADDHDDDTKGDGKFDR